MKIPLFGTTWDIKYVTNKKMQELYGEDGTENDYDGMCDKDNQILYINRNLHPHRKNLAIVHESMHALCDHVGIPVGDEEEEKIIRHFEHGVLELIVALHKVLKFEE